jgi:hypothetical protein
MKHTAFISPILPQHMRLSDGASAQIVALKAILSQERMKGASHVE